MNPQATRPKSKWWRIGIVLLALLNSTAGRSEPEILRLKKEGRTLFAQSKWQESKSVWGQVLKLSTRDVEALQTLGVIEDLLGNHQQANALLREAVKLQPNSSQALNNLALNYLKLNQPAEAISHLERAVKVEPKNANLNFNLGSLYFDQGMFLQAIAPLERARSISTADAAIEYKLVATFLQIQDVAKATEMWKRSDALRGASDPHVIISLAELFSKNGQFSLAAELYGLAARLDNRNPRLLYNQARAHYLAKEPVQGLKVLEEIGAGELKSAEFHRLKADLLFLIGKFDQALPEYHEAIQLAPQNSENYLRLAVVLLDGQAFSEAITFLRETNQRFPKSPRFLVAIGFAHQLKGDLETSLEYYRNAINLNPKESLPFIFLGKALLESDRSTEGLEALRQAVFVEPESAFCHYQLAKGLMPIQPDDLSEPIAHLRRAAALDPAFPDAQYDLGKLLIQRGNVEEARRFLERARDLNPKIAGVHYLLGQAYRRLGDSQKAMQALELHKTISQEEVESNRIEKRLIYSP